jgi:fucose permease
VAFFLSDGNDLCIKIWGSDHGPYLMAVFSGYSAGSLLAPVLTLPFLQERPKQMDVVYNLSISAQPNISEVKPLRNEATNSTIGLESVFGDQAWGLGPMHKLHLLVMGICLAVGVILALVAQQTNSSVKYDQFQDEDDITPRMKQKATRYMIVTLLGIYIFNIIGAEITYSSLLTPFVVKQFGESKKTGTEMTTLYWLVGLIGTVSFIPVSKYVKGSVIILGMLIAVTMATILLAIFGSSSTIVVWCSSACIGLGSGVSYAGVFLWASQYVDLTVQVSSILVSMSTFGEMAYPAMTGPFLDTYPMTLVYVLTGGVIVNCVIYACVEYLGRRACIGRLVEPLEVNIREYKTKCCRIISTECDKNKKVDRN